MKKKNNNNKLCPKSEPNDKRSQFLSASHRRTQASATRRINSRADTAMEPSQLVQYTYESLAYYTENFSESNCIGHFQFGKFYRAKIDFIAYVEYLMVKKWEVPETCNYGPGDNDTRLMEEMLLNLHEVIIDHPGMLKLYGYHWEGGHHCAVYNFKPIDSVFNLIPKEDFTWLQRIKVALGLASLLKYLHGGKTSLVQPFIVHNLDAAHILLDEGYNAKVCDFGSASGGILPSMKMYSDHDARLCYGCIDISNTGRCSNKQDVFAFGVILVSLISKRVYTEEDRQAGVPFIHEWALTEFEGDMENTNGFSLVDKSLAAEGEFCHADGNKITMVALQCVKRVDHERPTMKQVFRYLLKLEVVKKHAGFLGVNKFLQPCENAI